MKMIKKPEFQLKLGLKLWSSNTFYINPALELYQKGTFDYVELYIDPNPAKDYIRQWTEMEFPFVLHAPHSYSGLNFSQQKGEIENLRILKEVESFRLALNPKYVIFHPGIQGSDDETIRQINNAGKGFSALFSIGLIENKPKIGIKGEYCVGASPQEIERIIEETGLGFCLDIGHAICYATWAQNGWEKALNQFVKLGPKIYHLSDGNKSSLTDSHLHYGHGDYDLNRIINMISSNALLTIETDKDSGLNLEDFERDVDYLRNLNGMFA